MTPSKRFYVYTLTDPHDKVFYVGKGTGPRIFAHEAEARTDCRCHKCCKIRKIWRHGGEVRKYYVFETDNEDEAYGHEAQLIAEIGLKNLCNKTIGSRSSRSMSNEELAALREAIERFDEAERARKERERAERYWWNMRIARSMGRRRRVKNT